MAVITISRQYGSGGDEIADRVCQILGCHQFDRQLIVRSAVEAGITANEIANFSEENFRVRGFFERLFSRSRSMGQMLAVAEAPQLYGEYPMELRLSEELALTLVQKAIGLAYETGNMVIVGRGGQVVLKDRPGVLHVRIEAPIEDRIQHIKTILLAERTPSQDLIIIRRAAQDMIEERDASSADYLKCFYSVDWSDPFLYHVVFNTGMVSWDLAAKTIAEMALHLNPVRAD